MSRLVPRPDGGSGSELARRVRGALDPWIVVPAALVFLISLSSLFTVVYHPVAFEIDPELGSRIGTAFTKQLLWGVLGIVLMIGLAMIDLRELASRSSRIYLVALAMLVAVLIVGVKVRNIRAWLDLGIASFQPSELAKIAIVIALARMFSSPASLEKPNRALLASMVVVGIPAALVAKQPDMGTVIVYLSLLAVVPFAAGLPVGYFILVLISGLVASSRLLLGIADEFMGVIPDGPGRSLIVDDGFGLRLTLAIVGTGVILYFGMKRLRIRNAFACLALFVLPSAAYMGSFEVADKLKDYQKLRIFSFMAPQLDPKGAGYNVIQSQIAFGSGRFAGKGIGGATQSTLGFLPERQTDFIFSVVGEVFGFLGALTVILCFAVICLRSLRIASLSKSSFGSLLAVGAATIFLVHAAINIGMTIGLVPVMGIPLPLASYGGTAMITCWMLLGLVLAVEREGA